jgi:ketosteroid isomerase-like protein
MENRGGTPVEGAMMDQLRRALATQDFDALARLYAEDATLEEVSSINPPAHPLVVQGREAILQHLREQILRDPISGWRRQIAQSAVVEGFETEDGIAFTEERIYAAGDKAIAQHVARKRGGRISHDRLVVAWDPD